MISQELQERIENLIQSLGYTLYDIVFLKENQSDILRISITHADQPITLDACQMVSEALSPLLDVALSDQKSYFLEVSSPGVERILKTPRHFALSLHTRVRVRLEDKSEFEAVLLEAKEEHATFLLDDGVKQSHPYAALKKVKTILEW
ncbi:ribosome maturation factor RimP [Helicobacter mustelae]|uniref:Ribosome maturation factor RimP n=1 Tax=Helicobacter mustelae (strain ATCC 43772 / CCUG 25715 / CIP 103759 / LMG 18044 / NCTC 12198 / R85-136P) TaxID=679897 RepID=D3UG20_HELM1|nr:ribosome maturation factor RimP [Helicobacter mustelae]CBG39441.1 Putative hypothetical protein [Helicobacter mustelae 12198]SQH70953.1 Ribosome maturation factor rimP [Helicobacter mustelae]STP12079.1 Ribosome maturation factor rimP [Helicobacter mustelae]